MPKKTVHSGTSRGFADSVNALHTDTSLTDNQRAAIQNTLADSYRALGGDNVNLGKTVTASFDASPTYVITFVGVS